MRQVPNYFIIGSGRMATHFAEYLRLLSLPYQTWSRKTNTTDELHHQLNHATHILLLIKDACIEEFARALPRLSSQIFVHFSGSLAIDSVYSAHPLYTFGKTVYTLECYKRIPFITESGGPSLSTLLPGLFNPSFSIPSEQKPYYHALCVMSANFSTLLWKKLFDELERTFNIPPEMALPYLKQTCFNLEHSPQTALTGPLVRNDIDTIHKNLHALKNDPFHSIYEAFYHTYTGVNHERT